MVAANTLCKLPRGALLLSLSFLLCVREPQAQRRAYKQPLFATVSPQKRCSQELAQPRTEEIIHQLRGAPASPQISRLLKEWRESPKSYEK